MLRFLGIALLAAAVLPASERRGQVLFNGLPVPGATVSATQGAAAVTAVTDVLGLYSFADLADGTWTFEVKMFGFAPIREDVALTPDAPPARWDLKLLSLDQIHAQVQAPSAQPLPVTQAAPPAPGQSQTPPTPEEADDLNRRAADGFLINGSMNNGAASPFAQAAAFGNNRFGNRHLYTGGIGLIFDNSALDARPYSLTGQNSPKSSYNRITGLATFGGPLRIPRLFENGPVFFLAYQWTRNNNAVTQPGLVPDLAERSGLFPILDPITGLPFPGGVIPGSRISPQARALLPLYPLPNFDGGLGYNYQIPILSPTHQDALQSRLNKTLGRKDQVYGRFAFQSTRSDNTNLFQFLDATRMLGINTGVNWAHRLGQQTFLNLGYQFSRLASHVNTNFQNRENVSGDAGILGNNQDPVNWGPPTLTFTSGVAGLSDRLSSFDRNQTNGVSVSILWNRRSHSVTAGGDFRREEFNFLSQQNPRGSLTFTGAASGSAFGNFLLGIPATVSAAFGNADKYFRQSAYDAYIADDWRIGPQLTLNAGVRWEYGSPITELYDRLVNLDIAPGFTAAVPVMAGSGRFPRSLIQPDKSAFQPRVGIAWRPLSGSSLVVRAGYGVYYDTSVYQNIALAMAQQPPQSKTLSVQNKPPFPLTLANAFKAPGSANTFAVDPGFRVGYVQNWQLTMQRDLPGSLQMTAAYLGIKGTRGVQNFLPNTYPAGAVNPCPACPPNFAYLASNGNSTREAAEIQLRRRLHNGIAAILQYTFSKSIDDDAALGGQGGSVISQMAGAAAGPAANTANPLNLAVAQNWLDLNAERSLSSFDQRHLLSLEMQYTTGMGLGGGTLLGGWKGGLLKEWTIAAQINAGSGLPQTPVYLAPVEGTAVTGSIRPNFTAAPLYSAPAGLFLNPAAFTAPLPGQWGNAGRNTITGPAQFTLNASLGRTFRLSDRLNLDLRLDAANALNHVSYTAWNTVANGLQFGLPAAANAMRSVQLTLRLRF